MAISVVGPGLEDPSPAPKSSTRRSRGLFAAVRQTGGVQRGMLVTGAAITSFFLVVAVFAPWLAPYGFDDVTNAEGVRFVRLQAPSPAHWFGTTNGQGFDVLSQVIYGARTELIVVVLAVVLSLFIGVPLGLYSGYRGGWVDRVFVLVTDSLFAFPSLLLAIVVSIAFESGSSSAAGGILAAAISITVVYIPQYFRVVRNATITAKQEPYVEAARAVGASPWGVMRRYVFGNVVQSVPIIATVNAADAILTLAGLGFPRLRDRAVVSGRMGNATQQGPIRFRLGHLVDRSLSGHGHRAVGTGHLADRRKSERRAQPAAKGPSPLDGRPARTPGAETGDGPGADLHSRRRRR